MRDELRLLPGIHERNFTAFEIRCVSRRKRCAPRMRDGGLIGNGVAPDTIMHILWS